jgi:hypothetical protein
LAASPELSCPAWVEQQAYTVLELLAQLEIKLFVVEAVAEKLILSWMASGDALGNPIDLDGQARQTGRDLLAEGQLLGVHFRGRSSPPA